MGETPFLGPFLVLAVSGLPPALAGSWVNFLFPGTLSLYLLPTLLVAWDVFLRKRNTVIKIYFMPAWIFWLILCTVMMIRESGVLTNG